MHARVYVVGVGAGILLIVLLTYPLYQFLPSLVVADWPRAEPAVALGWSMVSGVALLATGAVAARLSGTKNRWEAAQAGSLAGLIAALMAEFWLGVPAAGMWGAHGVLLAVTPDWSNGNLISASQDVQWWIYASSLAAMLVGLGLGALGGGLAGPGGPPMLGMTTLGPTLALVGLITAYINFIVGGVIFSLLGAMLTKAAQKKSPELVLPATDLFWLALGGTFGLFVLWQLLGWAAAARARPITEGEYKSLRILIWVNGVLPLALVALTGLLWPGLGLAPLEWGWSVVVVALSGLTLTTLRQLGLPPEARRAPLSSTYLALLITLSGGIVFGTTYLCLVAPQVNLALLVVPLVGTNVPVVPLQSATALVETNFLVHQQIVLLAAAVTFIFATLVAGVVYIAEQIEQRATRSRS